MATSIIRFSQSDAYNFGDAVTLTLNQEYTIPADGYLHITGPYQGTSATRCLLNGAGVTLGVAGATGTSQQLIVYVKKNMVAKVTILPSTSDGGSVRYYPLV